MAPALGILIAALALTSIYFMGLHWLPVLASAHGATVDQQFHLNMLLIGGVFLIAQFSLAFAVASRSRTTPKTPRRTELTATLAATIFFLGLAVAANRVWARVSFLGPSKNPETVRVEVTAAQFRWYFRYPGSDGRLGETKPELVDAPLGNPVGINDKDPASKDDIVSSVLVLPQGREAEITLRSQDVIHSFFVPAMRVKQDAVPGMTVTIHLTPTKSGEYDLSCAELCGMGHFGMNAKVRVLSEADYGAWLAQRERQR